MKNRLDYKSDSDKDLSRKLSEKREALRVFQFGGAGSKARDVREGRLIKKDIARLLTEVSERGHKTKA